MQTINKVTKDCFNALIEFSSLDGASAVSPQLPYQRLCELIDQMQTKARQAKFGKSDVETMAYAVVALADEFALHKGGAIRYHWMQQPLQLHYFKENLAGEHFFQKLDALMRDPKRVEILRVYYVCLLLGFQGRYAIRGGELELDAIIHDVKQALRDELEDRPLSVQPLSPKEDNGTGAGFPAMWVALFFLLFSLGLLIILRIGLDKQTRNAVERVQPMMQPSADG